MDLKSRVGNRVFLSLPSRMLIGSAHRHQAIQHLLDSNLYIHALYYLQTSLWTCPSLFFMRPSLFFMHANPTASWRPIPADVIRKPTRAAHQHHRPALVPGHSSTTTIDIPPSPTMYRRLSPHLRQSVAAANSTKRCSPILSRALHTGTERPRSAAAGCSRQYNVLKRSGVAGLGTARAKAWVRETSTVGYNKTGYIDQEPGQEGLLFFDSSYLP